MPGIEIKGRSKIANYRHGGRTKKFGGGRTNLLEQLGRVEAEPSNPNRRAEISRVHGELNRGYKTGGRVGLKHGGKPWGDKPKPGTHEYMMQEIHKRKGKAAGGILKVGKQAIQKIISKIRKKPETTWKELDIPGYPPIHKGKYPGIDKAMENVKKHGDIRGKIGKAAGGRIGYKVGYHVKPKPKEWPPKDWQKFKLRTWPKQKSFVEQLGGSEKGKPHSTKEGRIASGTRRIKRLISADKKAAGGRIGLKKGGSDKKWIQKAVNPKHKGYCTPMTKKTCTPARKALARTFKKKAKTGW